jgi:hypothetical protein
MVKINKENVTLEEVCELSKGFKSDYDAVHYFLSNRGVEVSSIKPKEFARYMTQLTEVSKHLDPESWKKKYKDKIRKNKDLINRKKNGEKTDYSFNFFNRAIKEYEKSLKKLPKEEKPKFLNFKDHLYKVDYNIRYAPWWPHAVYLNTVSKQKENNDINPISLALACFMCYKVKGKFSIELAAEFEEELLSSRNGVDLFNIGFFLGKKQSLFKRILLKLLILFRLKKTQKILIGRD